MSHWISLVIFIVAKGTFALQEQGMLGKKYFQTLHQPKYSSHVCRSSSIFAFVAGEALSACSSDEWKEYGESCYYFYTGDPHYDYADARAFCLQNGSLLVSINDAEENQFILDNIRKPDGSIYNVWIGLTSKLLIDISLYTYITIKIPSPIRS
jgi:hypothetical protein